MRHFGLDSYDSVGSNEHSDSIFSFHKSRGIWLTRLATIIFSRRTYYSVQQWYNGNTLQN